MIMIVAIAREWRFIALGKLSYIRYSMHANSYNGRDGTQWTRTDTPRKSGFVQQFSKFMNGGMVVLSSYMYIVCHTTQ